MLYNVDGQLVSYLLRKNGAHSTLNAYYFLPVKYKWT